MIKYVILFIHLIGLSIFQLFFGDISASQKLPSIMQAGSEVVVEIVIVKDEVSGFAKVQQTLPEGFVVEVIEAKGATFSFKDNIIKFIWMALPSDKEFTISYKLKSDKNLVGEFTFGGKFSFISDNERKNIDISSANIKVVKEISLDNDITENSNKEPVENKIKEPVFPPVVVANIQPVSKKITISASRTVEEKDNRFKVSVQVAQTNLEGFSKFSDVIPTGFTAVSGNSEGGVFSFNDGEAKIIWMSAPQKVEFTLTYFLESTKITKNGFHQILGSFSYLENDETKKQIIDATGFRYSGEIIAVVPPEKVMKPKTEKVIETAVKKDIASSVKSNDKPKEDLNSNKVSSTQSSEKGVTYKVQVGAGHRTVSNNYFAAKFKLTDKVSIETHQGWIKYLVGNFEIYKDARDKRNNVRNNVQNAFVTAYNQGTRITVQEALMISNQKWYQ